MSPDPYVGSYDFNNPQSLNRYAYVNNMPLSGTDPSGLLYAVPRGGGGDDDNGWLSAIVESFSSLIGYHPAFHGSLAQRPGVQTRRVLSHGVSPKLGGNGEYYLQTGITELSNGMINFGRFDADIVSTLGAVAEDLAFLPLRLHDKNWSRISATRYCGPGGHGEPNSHVDAACRAHDDCYATAKLDFKVNLGFGTFSSAQREAAHKCNVDLYFGVAAYPAESGSTAIRTWLRYGDVFRILAPGTAVDPRVN